MSEVTAASIGVLPLNGVPVLKRVYNHCLILQAPEVSVDILLCGFS